jgi:hypothetical protein
VQVNYTQIKYDYTGSDMFFGDSGTPMKPEDALKAGQDPVTKANDLRVAIRYRY